MNIFDISHMCFLKLSISFFFISILLTNTVLGKKIETSKPIKPKLILIQHNPWINSINSDEPDLLIYTNGDVICKQITEKYKCIYHIYSLRSGLWDSIQDYITKYADSFQTLPPTVDAYKAFSYHVPDQPSNDLYFYIHKKLIKINIYGELSAPTVLSKIPVFLSRFIKIILSIKKNSAPIYEPINIELMLWPSPFLDNSKEWPSNWPHNLQPNDKPHTSYKYTLNLEKSKEDSLRNLLSSLNDKESILINKMPFSILYRYTWPCENQWRNFDTRKVK